MSWCSWDTKTFLGPDVGPVSRGDVAERGAPVAWSRVINTTIRKYIRDVEVAILRNRVLTAMLKSRGRFTYNWGGERMDWKVEYKRNRLDGYADGDNLIFSRKDRWKSANLGWRGYAMTDAMTKVERLMNSGTEAIVKVYSEIAPNLMRDMEEWFSEEYYIDGTTSANYRRMHGIESFMSGTGTGSGSSPVVTANGTFAGLSCALAAYGGTWSGTWPSGRGTPDYDFWTPLLIDTGCSFWGTSATTWAANCIQSLRYAIIKSQRSRSARGKLDFILIDDDMFRNALEVFDTMQRVQVQTNTGVRQFGFSNTFNLDGTDVTWEYGSPQGTGYGFNCNEMEIRSMQGQLFEAEGPDYDMGSRTWRLSVDFIGNTVWTPKFFTKLYNYTAPLT